MMIHYVFDTCHRLIRESCTPTIVHVHLRSRMTHSVIINNLQPFLSFRRLSVEVCQPKTSWGFVSRLKALSRRLLKDSSLGQRLYAEDLLRTCLWAKGSLPKTSRGLVFGPKALCRRLLEDSSLDRRLSAEASQRLISGLKAFGASFIVSRMKLLLFYHSSQIRALQLLLKSVSFSKRSDLSNVQANLDSFSFMNIFPFVKLRSCLNILAISRLNINNTYWTPT